MKWRSAKRFDQTYAVQEFANYWIALKDGSVHFATWNPQWKSFSTGNLFVELPDLVGYIPVNVPRHPEDEEYSPSHIRVRKTGSSQWLEMNDPQVPQRVRDLFDTDAITSGGHLRSGDVTVPVEGQSVIPMGAQPDHYERWTWAEKLVLDADSLVTGLGVGT